MVIDIEIHYKIDIQRIGEVMKEKNKFMFFVPNNRWFGRRCWFWFVPAVALLVPILKKRGISVEVLEANLDNLNEVQIKNRITEFEPDIVGISNLSLEYWRQPHFCAKLVKEVDKDIITIMGGVHPTVLPNKVMEDQNIDFVILGEGEERLYQFLNIINSKAQDFSKMDGIGYRVNGDVIIKKPVRLIHDLDEYPLPDYSIFDWKKVMTFSQKSVVGLGTRRTPVGLVSTSRGCRYRCNFCAGRKVMGNKVRLRSVKKILEEVDMLVGKYKIKELIFTDDEMYDSIDRAVEIIKGIKKRNYDLIWKNTNLASWRMDKKLIKLMKESRCYQITISPESGNARVLKEIIHKPGTKDDCRKVVNWCREADIEIEADFVIGFPGEKWEEIRDTINFAEELDADAVKFAIATPFPETELFKTAVSCGYLNEDFDFYRDDYLGFAHGVINTEEFTVNELEMLRCLEWDRINFKTKQKSEKWAKMNMMTLEELEDFRKATRRNVGVYFLDQISDERDEIDKVITRT